MAFIYTLRFIYGDVGGNLRNMHTEKIYDENGKGFTRVFTSDKIEKVNPVEYYKTYELKKRAISLRDILNVNNPFLTSFLDDDFFIKKAEEMLVGFFEKFEGTEIHENFIKLLGTNRKKDQVKLLRGMTINPDELMSLIFKSYNDFGYLYSKYHIKSIPKGFEGKKRPKIFRVEKDGSIEKYGETDLTDGELKHLIENRKIIVSHFFENDEQWHCFFLTYKSIGGKENWKNGQPHFHYISSAFGISKDDFIESMKSGKYKSTPVHIDLLEYGVQPDEKSK
jgi:hypothetical protein